MSYFWFYSDKWTMVMCLEDCTEFDANLVEFKSGLTETSDGVIHIQKSCGCIPKPKDELINEISILKKKREKLEEKRCRLSFMSKDFDVFSKKNKDIYFLDSYETELSKVEETLDKIDTAIKHGKMILNFLEEIEENEEKERQLRENKEKQYQEEEKKCRIKYLYNKLNSLKSKIEKLEQEINEL